MRSRKVTSLELVNLFIDHLETVDIVINAVTAARYQQARKEATALDKLIERKCAYKSEKDKPVFLTVLHVYHFKFEFMHTPGQHLRTCVHTYRSERERERESTRARKRMERMQYSILSHAHMHKQFLGVPVVVKECMVRRTRARCNAVDRHFDMITMIDLFCDTDFWYEWIVNFCE